MKLQAGSLACTVLLTMVMSLCNAQQITGVWKGRISSKKVELKLIKSGDSLVGTSYYYDSRNNYRRYTIKGYFDPSTNNVIWWDDQLIENKSSGRSNASENALLSVADFNCPGEDEMRLDGTTSLRDDKEIARNPVNLLKVGSPVFPDEWDFVIDNYTSGTNDPYFIDSINRLRSTPAIREEELVVAVPIGIDMPNNPAPVVTAPDPKPALPDPADNTVAAKAPGNLESKFTSRKKVLQNVIPVTGKMIELRFYDNGIIDGDSIAIFFNGALLHENIRLALEPFVIQLPTNELQDDNELVMVAQNLGTIPPNTSMMVVEMGNKTYEARLYANENSSALVRFVKNAPGNSSR
ncbi:MAG: hypothetical protein H7Y03_11635 [Chitinophagaceae bacterium]|nr:hypothetical protein [Chitinophagaceae bacterium]